jgi:hypothetical protein
MKFIRIIVEKAKLVKKKYYKCKYIKQVYDHLIKYKVFETLSNQINDETFNQIQAKLAYYKQLSEEAFIMAYTEIKKQDVWTKQRRVRNDLQRFAQYELPNRSSRYGSGWNR